MGMPGMGLSCSGLPGIGHPCSGLLDSCVVLCCGHGLVQEQLPDSEAIRLGMDGVIGTGSERRGSRLKK